MLRRSVSAVAILFTGTLGVDAAGYIGSQACAACHAAIYRSFMATPMARSSGRIGTEDPKETFDHPEYRDAEGNFSYRVSAQPGSYYLDFRGQKQPVQGRYKLDYFVGSVAAARSFLLKIDASSMKRR